MASMFGLFIRLIAVQHTSITKVHSVSFCLLWWTQNTAFVSSTWEVMEELPTAQSSKTLPSTW